MDMMLLNTLARGVAIGALAGMATGLWPARANQPARLAGMLFCVGVIAYTINSAPRLIDAMGWLGAPIHFLAFGGVGLFWLFIVALFEDRPVSLATLAPWILLTLVGFVGFAAPPATKPQVWVVHNLIEAGFSLHALHVIARSWRGDLVEARRRLRGPFLAIVTLYVLTLSAFEIAESVGYFQDWFRLLSGATLALYCVAGAAVFLRARPEMFGTAAPAIQAPANGLDSGDRATLGALRKLMNEAEAWRREGLTIGELAAQIGVPEHRLRRLINDHLGFRNFAAFVNERRIEAAKRLLVDPAQARQTVAAIAYDLGFGSLGPFNRAFREATGKTPTQWRKQASPIPENPR